MKKMIIMLPLVMLLSGCGTLWFKSPFPDVPEKLMTKPAELKTIAPADKVASYQLTDGAPSGIPFSTVSKIIFDNYTTCNLYQEQIFGLQNWILDQKKLNR